MKLAVNLSPMTIDFFNRATRTPLKEGDVIEMFDHTFHYIQYVNQAGAYAVPLAAVTRDIKGHVANFTAGGKTISVLSAVKVINPLAMGGSSPEYRRYVTMASKGGKAAAMADGPGAPFGTFDTAELPEGHAGDFGAETATVSLEEAQEMAKKAAGKKAAAKRDKTPKTVRQCACGCGNETTGHFAPGHDAKLHGWIKKLADGRIQRNGKDAKSGEQIISQSVLNKLKLVAKGDGFKATAPEFYKDAD